MKPHYNHSRPRYGLPLEPHKLLAELYLRLRLGCQTAAVALPWDKLAGVPQLPWASGTEPGVVVEPTSMWLKLHRKKHGFSLVASRVKELAIVAGATRFLLWEDAPGLDTAMIAKWQTLTGQTFELVAADAIVAFWRELEASPPAAADPATMGPVDNPLAQFFRDRQSFIGTALALPDPAASED